MRNIKLIIEYDGTNYHGWQRQANAVAIEELVEKALLTILREEIKLTTAGRTDTGVHAINQVVNFSTENTIRADRLFLSLNAILPNDIVIKSVEDVPDNFDARRSAKSKRYRYVILNSKAPTALYRKRAWHVRAKLDTDLMLKGAEMLLGEHDFSSFRGKGCVSKHAVRRMLNVSINVVGEAKEYIYFEIEGQAFLKHMVRNIVGTLVALGSGKIGINEFKSALDARDRTKAGVTAPPQGLYLVEVKY